MTRTAMAWVFPAAAPPPRRCRPALGIRCSTPMGSICRRDLPAIPRRTPSPISSSPGHRKFAGSPTMTPASGSGRWARSGRSPERPVSKNSKTRRSSPFGTRSSASRRGFRGDIRAILFLQWPGDAANVPGLRHLLQQQSELRPSTRRIRRGDLRRNGSLEIHRRRPFRENVLQPRALRRRNRELRSGLFQRRLSRERLHPEARRLVSNGPRQFILCDVCQGFSPRRRQSPAAWRLPRRRHAECVYAGFDCGRVWQRRIAERLQVGQHQELRNRLEE